MPPVRRRRLTETCACRKRRGLKGCRWFKSGQPGPQEHAYKCEVFYATAGNFITDPLRLLNLRMVVAQVLGFIPEPHPFGVCGRLWTIAALLYRLRDGPMANSFALALTPRPTPPTLLPTVQAIGRSDKLFNPRSHIFDRNPFSGIGVNKREFEARASLSHIQVAIWSTHASWLARMAIGLKVDWDLWEFSHIAPAPRELLGSAALSNSPLPPPRPQAPTPSRGAAVTSDSGDEAPSSYNWFMGERRHYAHGPPDSPESDHSDSGGSLTEDQDILTPPQKQGKPISLDDIRAFGSWKVEAAPSFGSELSPDRLMRRRSAEILGRVLPREPSPLPPPRPASVSKRATYSGLGFGVAAKVPLRTAKSSIIQLGSAIRLYDQNDDYRSSWSESVSSSPSRSTPTRSGGVARPLIRHPRRALPDFLID